MVFEITFVASFFEQYLPPQFGSSVNPIPIRGGGTDYAHPVTACTPGFEYLTASLNGAKYDTFDGPDCMFI